MVESMNVRIIALETEVEPLRDVAEDRMGRGDGGGRKNITESKMMADIPKYKGKDDNFDTFEFRISQMVASYKHFEDYMDWVKGLEEEPDIGALTFKAQAVQGSEPSVDIHWYDQQPFSILAMKTDASALQIVKNVKSDTPVRGCRAWFRMTRDVAGRTGSRLAKQLRKAHYPNNIASNATALSDLMTWDTDVKESENIEARAMSDFTKFTTLKSMVMDDLLRVIERDATLKTFADAWNFVLAQIPLRKQWSAKKRGPNDMDVDVAEDEDKPKDKETAEEQQWCQPCNGSEGDLFTMKGQGGFNGYCSFCWAWGHKRPDCRKRIAAEGKDGGKGGSKGQNPKGGGKDGGKTAAAGG